MISIPGSSESKVKKVKKVKKVLVYQILLLSIITLEMTEIKAITIPSPEKHYRIARKILEKICDPKAIAFMKMSVNNNH